MGLNRVQWDNALHWMDEYANKERPDRVLRVLGPTFSGSVPSFVRAIEDVKEHAGIFDSALLYTGRIRGCGSWLWLKSKLNPPPSPSATPGLPVRVADFEENDSVQSDRLYQYLRDRGHRLSEVAVLSEDETAYGGLPDARSAGTDANSAALSPCAAVYPYNDRPVHLYYPRDISAIRSAYQEQSIFSPGTKTDASAAPHTVLQPGGDAAEHNMTDAVEPFSGMNLALTQEAQLYGIVNTLKTHGIRFVLLRSTNSLDYLFLTRFLHRAYPTAYIVTMGSDLLYGREVDSTEFRGVVSLSSFPLLPRGRTGPGRSKVSSSTRIASLAVTPWRAPTWPPGSSSLIHRRHLRRWRQRNPSCIPASPISRTMLCRSGTMQAEKTSRRSRQRGWR